MVEKITILPPRDPWPVSSITDADLEALVDVGLLQHRTTGLQPEWIAPHVSRCLIRPQAISLALPRSMNGASEFCRITLCEPYRTTRGGVTQLQSHLHCSGSHLLHRL
jgi:hypothetical protein